MRISAEAALRELYGISAAGVVPLSRGHTNESFAVDAGTGRFVLRLARSVKAPERVAREERVLEALSGEGAHDTPRIIRTLHGDPHALLGDGRVAHLFSWCDGDPPPRWLGRGDDRRICTAMIKLADIHRRLSQVADAPPGSWRWLVERLDRVRNGDLGLLPPDGRDVLARIEEILEHAPPLDGAQWLHGDYHLGNLLFSGSEVTAVVDFDDVATGSPDGEAAMALFAFARRDDGEACFSWDSTLWTAGLHAYANASGRAMAGLAPDALAPVFYAYQVVVHLEAAQLGAWTLEPGIGFWPCWNGLLQTERR